MPCYCTIVQANAYETREGQVLDGPTPDLSVVIPAYNRNEIIEDTLNSVIWSEGAITVEIIIVDDGSDVPVEQGLKQSCLRHCRILRQRNQGLLFARLAGLKTARGRYVLFLDSDDFVSSDKLVSHVRDMDDRNLDISYTDFASAVITNTGAPPQLDDYITLPETNDHAYFFLRMQPAPHSPAFRREYLLNALKSTSLAPSTRYNLIAEIYIYFVCSLQPAVLGKSKGFAITGIHPGTRITNHWEPMGLAALAIMESFIASTPNTSEGVKAKTYVGEAAFHTWRALPYDFPVVVRRRFRRIAMNAPKQRLSETGGKYFRFASRALGPFTAGAILRRIRGAPYRSSQTMSNSQLEKLLQRLDNACI